MYSLHGLRVRLPLPLAGFAPTDDGFDVDIRLGPSGPVPTDRPRGVVVASRQIDDRYLYVACEAGARITLRVPGVCDFVIDKDRRAVECRIDPAADDGLVGILAGGLLIGFLLGLRGEFVLHASAVEFDGVAIAIAGDSGRGKSTLAALLCAAGARLVADDVLRFDLTGTPRCLVGVPELRLRPKAAWVIERFATPPSTSPTADGRVALRLPTPTGPSIPLAGLLIAYPSEAIPAVELQPVRGAAALLELAPLARVVGWKEPTTVRQQFRSLARVANEVPVMRALVPWGPDVADAIAPSIFALVRPT